MKKITLGRAGAVALAAMMSLSLMAGPASAANIKITGTAGQYSAYRLLDLTTSLKADHVNHDGEHSNGCWNYNYTVNEKYRSLLQGVVPASADKDGVTGLSDDEIMNYMEGLTDPDALRAFAGQVYGAMGETAAEATVDGDASGVTNIDIGENQGYYLIVESQKDEGGMVSFVMLDTAGQDDVAVVSKESVPTLEKKIIDGTDRVDGISVAAGDEVTYELTIKIPNGALLELDDLNLKVHDVMAPGLELIADSFTQTHTGDLVEGATLPQWSFITEGKAHEQCDFEATLALGDASTILAKGEHTFVLTYKAKALDATTLVMGKAGNLNAANLEFSSNPYDAADTSVTPQDTVKVYTFGLIVNKVDGANQALAGANFKLQMKGQSGEFEDVTRFTPEFDGGKTQFTFDRLDEGEYQLIETKTPDGYASIDPMQFKIVRTINADGELTGFEVQAMDGTVISSGEDATFGANLDNGIASTSVINIAGNRMPTTGGEGTYALYIGGAVLLFVAGAAVVLKKKKSTDAQ